MLRNFLYQTSLFLRSLLFSMVMVVTVFIFCFLCLLAIPFPLKTRFKIISFWTGMMIWMLKVICGVNYKITGLENIPKDRNGIILCKHQSTWETFILPTLFEAPAIITKRELLWVPFFGWGMATADPIAINRSDKSSAMQQIIKKGKKSLAQGRWIIVFPEGTRIPPGKIGHYRAGGARLAVKTDSPVLPIAHNAGYFWPRKGFIKKPGTVQMAIGPLIETTNKSAEGVLKEAKDWIETKMLELENCHSRPRLKHAGINSSGNPSQL